MTNVVSLPTHPQGCAPGQTLLQVRSCRGCYTIDCFHVYDTAGQISLQEPLQQKSPPANAGGTRDTGSIPGSGRFPGGGNGNSLQYSSWRIPWTEEPGGLQSTGSQRVRHDLATKQQLYPNSLPKPVQEVCSQLIQHLLRGLGRMVICTSSFHKWGN